MKRLLPQGRLLQGELFPSISALFRPRPPRASEDGTERLEPHLAGELVRLPALRSRFLAAERDILVYLPAPYAAQPERRFPVLYMNDGQNLFDPRTSFVPGKDWRLGETVDELIAGGEIAPLVVVGIGNAGVHRIDEYTPTRDKRRGFGGDADLYGRFLIEELKPYIDHRFRTLPEPEHTGLGGSSLGGLVSLHLGLKNPDVFGRLAALSPSAWWDDGVILTTVGALARKPDLRVWLDMGTREDDEARQFVRRLDGVLVARGWRPGVDLAYREIRGGEHSERAWGDRTGKVLRFLFPPARPRPWWRRPLR